MPYLIFCHRTNRTKKTKILRCFPHCCPKHVNRSYCGSSLRVRVEIVNSARLHAQPQNKTTEVIESNPSNLLVYGHFEEAHTQFLAINDLIDNRIVTDFIQTEQTPKGTWIGGTVVSDSVTNRECIFQLNPGARWYYEWESAATKSQRFTKHALRVYIFERVLSKFRVLGLVSSTDFMIVSYRRSTAELNAGHEAFEVSRAVQQNINSDGNEDGKNRAAIASKVSNVEQPLHSTFKEDIWQSCILWEYRHPDIMRSSKQLAILFYFVNHVSALPYKTCLQQLRNKYKRQIEDFNSETSYGAAKDIGAGHHVIASLSWTFLNSLERLHCATYRYQNNRNAKVGEEVSLTQLVEICTGLVVWLALDNDNLKIYRSIFQSSGTALLDLTRLRAGYVETVAMICKLVNRYFDDPVDSLPLLCEEIVTAVFQNEQLKLLRRELLDLLSSNTMHGMQDFVAQLRAQYLLQQSCSAPHCNFLPQQKKQYTSAFDGLWVFNGHESLITPTKGSNANDVSLGKLITFMCELARVSIRPVDCHSLQIFSEWNVCNVNESKSPSTTDSIAGLKLVLDNRQRVFSNFPSGVSSSITHCGQHFGDYCGKLISPSNFAIELHSWPAKSSIVHQALRYKLDIGMKTTRDIQHSNRRARSLLVKAVVEEGVWRADISIQGMKFQVMPFKRKTASVKAWNSVYEMLGVYDRIC
ncbi:hypothetical protein Plhal304r1_c022g0076331 [Plasmopara halstedii]